MVLAFESVDKILKCDLSNKKATEQYFPVVLFCARWFKRLSPWTKSYSPAIKVKVAKQFFPVVLHSNRY